MNKKRYNREYVKVLVMSGLLAAMNIILGKFFQITPTESMRFSIGALPVIFGGMVFGPVMGGCIGLTGDLVGCLVTMMSINPIIAAGSAMIGVTAGLFKINKNQKYGFVFCFVAAISAHIVGSMIIKSIGMHVYYGTPFSVLALRIPVYTVNSLVEAFLVTVLLSRKEILKLLPLQNKGEKQ